MPLHSFPCKGARFGKNKRKGDLGYPGFNTDKEDSGGRVWVSDRGGCPYISRQRVQTTQRNGTANRHSRRAPPTVYCVLMDDLHVAMEAARAGGAIVAEHFGTSPDPEYKGKFDPVTAVDRASETAVLAVIGTHRPRDPVMAEESGGTRHDGRHWIVDPLDGTVNFVHGIPHVSVSVALYEGDTGLVGVVYANVGRAY